jgi:hypothetical protein
MDLYGKGGGDRMEMYFLPMGWMAAVQFQARGEIFLFAGSAMALGPTKFPIQQVMGNLSLG